MLARWDSLKKQWPEFRKDSMSCQRSSSWSWKRHAYQEDFCPVLSLPLPAQNLRTLLSVERLCYIRTIQKLWLNWPDITQKQQKQANAICRSRTFHSQDLIPHQEWPVWKLKYYQQTKSIPKRAAWSDIQRKRLLLLFYRIVANKQTSLT